MADIKFGTKQLGRPTPQGVSIWMDFSVGVMGVVAAFLNTSVYVPHYVSDPVSSVLTGLVIPILLYMKRFFGQQVNSTTVNIDNVSEIKDDPTDKK